jgi:selenocysteine-specific elongation factor
MRWVGSSDLQPGESGIVQFHFEESVTASFKETFVLRSYSPAETIGGGLVLDNRPSLLRKKDQVAAAAIWQLAAMQLKEALIWFIEYTPPFFFSIPELVFRFTELPEKLQNVFNSLLTTQQVIRIAKFYLAAKRYQIWQSALLSVLKNHHSQNPVSPGLDKMALMRFIQLPLEIIDHLVADLSINGNLQKTDDLISLKGFSPRLSPEQERLKQKIEQQVLSAGFNPPDSKQLMQQFRADPQTILVLVKLLIHEGKLEMIEGQLLYHQDILVEGRRRLQEHLRKVGKASVSELKELLETSRKWALPLLNYYDQKGVTFRDGVYRKLVE